MSGTVMVIEDDPTQRDMYCLALEAAGISVEAMPDGASVMERATSLAVDGVSLVLLDLGLPDISGEGLLRELRRNLLPEVPVIILTAQEASESVIGALDAGANDYIVKPVVLSELIARVRAHLRAKSEWDEIASEATRLRARIGASLVSLDGGSTQGAVLEALLAAAGGAGPIESVATGCQGPRVLTQGRAQAQWVPGGMDVTDNATGASVLDIEIKVDGVVAAVLSVASEGGSPFEIIDDRRVLANVQELAGAAIGPAVRRIRAETALADRIRAMSAGQSFETVYQPIVSISRGHVIGHEALTRFEDGTRPDLVFAEAGVVGLKCELEKATAMAAVERASGLPAGTFLSINLSAETAMDGDFLEGLVQQRSDIIIEITEHDSIDDFERLHEALDRVRGRAAVALDDVGAGYASLGRVRRMRPDVIKLDRELISGLDDDPIARAMVAGLVHFASEVNCRLVAEGVETVEERAVLQALGVGFGQGFLWGRPAPLAVDEAAA